MGGAVQLSFDRLPKTALLFPRALRPKPGVLPPGASVPRMSAALARAHPDPDHVARFRALCGFAHDSRLPVTYPHVLAGPLHLALLTHVAFPLRVLGAVQARVRIQQHRALRLDECLAVNVWLEGAVPVDSGLEVDVHTEVRSGEETAWEEVSTMLLRSPHTRRKESRPFTPPDFSDFRTVAELRAPEDIGWRYGWVANDLNPVHLHWLAARVFGYPRAIAHGMWTLARSIAELQRANAVGACTVEGAFKRPLPLPSRSVLVARGAPDDTSFALHDGIVKMVFLVGRVTA